MDLVVRGVECPQALAGDGSLCGVNPKPALGHGHEATMGKESVSLGQKPRMLSEPVLGKKSLLFTSNFVLILCPTITPSR